MHHPNLAHASDDIQKNSATTENDTEIHQDLPTGLFTTTADPISMLENKTISTGIDDRNDIQKALPSFLQSTSGNALLSAPYTVMYHCLSPPYFHIAIY
eukprot:15365814-Ditylum_brightwellii.AAC.1